MRWARREKEKILRHMRAGPRYYLPSGGGPECDRHNGTQLSDDEVAHVGHLLANDIVLTNLEKVVARLDLRAVNNGRRNSENGKEREEEKKRERHVCRKWRSCDQTVGNGKASFLFVHEQPLSLAKEKRVPTSHVQMSFFCFFAQEFCLTLPVRSADPLGTSCFTTTPSTPGSSPSIKPTPACSVGKREEERPYRILEKAGLEETQQPDFGRFRQCRCG